MHEAAAGCGRDPTAGLAWALLGDLASPVREEVDLWGGGGDAAGMADPLDAGGKMVNSTRCGVPELRRERFRSGRADGPK